MGQGVLEESGHGVSTSLKRGRTARAIREADTSLLRYSAYMYRLSLEYTRILHHDEEDVDYVAMPSFDDLA